MFHVALAKSAGEPLFRIDQQTNLVLFQGLQMEGGPALLLADKKLFHGLSLLLALVANGYHPNYETMHHRGQVLELLNQDLSHSDGHVPSLQTITAILMLISYEYRVQDTWPVPATAATHIHGLQSIINQRITVSTGYSHGRIRQIQRALVWQDIICSLATGTPRLLQFDNHDVFARLRENQMYRSYFALPQGFLLHAKGWPALSSAVFEDLNVTCHLVDRMHGQDRTSIHSVDDELGIVVASLPLMEDLDYEGYPLCNSQANLEVRLVDLLSETTRGGSPKQEELTYRACLFAAYLCTYRLSTGLWEGYFAPEKCATEILDCMAEFTRHMSPWKLAPDISFWLLHVAGGLTKSHLNKTRAAALMQRYRCFYPSGYYQDWELVEMKLNKFIWCEHTMKETLYTFWQQCRHDWRWGSLGPIKAWMLAVCVASATVVHAEETNAAIAAGKHVLCEKPLGTTVEISQSAVDAAATRSDLKDVCGFCRRFDDSYRDAYEKTESGLIGRPSFVSQESKARSVHAVGITAVEPDLRQYNDRDNAVGIVAFCDGRIAYLYASRMMAAGQQDTTGIVGTKGKSSVNLVPVENHVRIYEQGGIRHELPQNYWARFQAAFTREAIEFTDSVLDDTPTCTC
ncbi:hypothetical protein F66182_4162 [Fusarium sp. NRRL 66182]|nr:hypothetical protein F66182_4162 [Fusarium sp. NRRL 66182]